MSDEEPYRCLLHYDPTIADGVVWIGNGRDLHPACGQSEYIGVTPNAEIVECLKCKAILDKSGAR